MLTFILIFFFFFSITDIFQQEIPIAKKGYAAVDTLHFIRAKSHSVSGYEPYVPSDADISRIQMQRIFYSRSPQRAARDPYWQWSNQKVLLEPTIDRAAVSAACLELMADIFGLFLAFVEPNGEMDPHESLEYENEEERKLLESKSDESEADFDAELPRDWKELWDRVTFRKDLFLLATPPKYRQFYDRVFSTQWFDNFWLEYTYRLLQQGPGRFEQIASRNASHLLTPVKLLHWQNMCKDPTRDQSRRFSVGFPQKRVICLRQLCICYAPADATVGNLK